MDSSRPPPSSPPSGRHATAGSPSRRGRDAGAGPRSLRPWYLVAAMVLTWFIGVNGLTSGCVMSRQLGGGAAPDMATATQSVKNEDDPRQLIAAIHDVARVQAMSEVRQLTFPLSVAKLLLAGLLVVASGLAMAGRPGSRSLALQALAANAALALLAYALTRDVRASWIDIVSREGATIGTLDPTHAKLVDGRLLWWIERTQLATLLGALAVAALALTRARTKVFFEAVAAQAADRDDS